MKGKSPAVAVITILFWLTPIVLALVQYLFVLHSQRLIRYEELAESVRNVYFLQHRLVYDGGSSNVGWYAILLLCYSLFGFTLHTALFFRLGVYLVSLYLLAIMVRRYLAAAFAFVPLLTVGLSPTLMYFNGIEISLGIDIEYFIICLFLITSLDSKKPRLSYVLTALCWSVAMVACLSYPVFLDYLPSLVILYIWRIRETFARQHHQFLGFMGVSALSILAPLAAAFAYVKNRSVLVYDPGTGEGLFRGGGNLKFNWNDFAHATAGVLRDLFSHGSSYYFYVAQSEFSGYYPIISVILITTICTLILIKFAPLRLYVALALLTGILSFITVGITSDGSGFPGIRRATAIVSVFYVCMAIVWVISITGKPRLGVLRYLGVGACCLLLAHHIVVIPANLATFPGATQKTDSEWFSSAQTPQASLDVLVKKAQQGDLYLACPPGGHERTPCRYNEVFPAIAGSCLWNRPACHEIFGMDLKTGMYIPLNVDLWTRNYFQH